MKTCFVVCPIGKEDSLERKRSDTVLKHIIKPICETLDFDVIRVDQIHDVDKIDNTILEHLEKADLVIADLTAHNPNAYYELGYRHALGKPLIPIMEEGTKIPFDLSHVRTISYVTNDFDKAEGTKNKIRDTILALNISSDKENQELTIPRTTSELTISTIPYLLAIEDRLEDIKALILTKNDELISKIFDMSINQIQKNSAKPEDKAMEMFFSTLFKEPNKLEAIMELAQKYGNVK